MRFKKSAKQHMPVCSIKKNLLVFIKILFNLLAQLTDYMPNKFFLKFDFEQCSVFTGGQQVLQNMHNFIQMHKAIISGFYKILFGIYMTCKIHYVKNLNLKMVTPRREAAAQLPFGLPKANPNKKGQR